MISGSWDKTAILWSSRASTLTLTGHEAAVLAVAILPETDIIVTVSADRLIKLWKMGVNTHTLAGEVFFDFTNVIIICL